MRRAVRSRNGEGLLNIAFRIVATLTGACVGWLLADLAGVAIGAVIGFLAGRQVIKFGEKEGE
jgi:hypothetical protein